MSVAQATLFDVESSDPFRGACPSCQAEVLAVEVDGRDVTVEVAEVLAEFDCPDCAQVLGRGHRRSYCARCGGTRRIGEPLPLRGVAVDEHGRACRWRRGDTVAEGRAIHPLHSCLPSDV